jgi:hypothetical protein
MNVSIGGSPARPAVVHESRALVQPIRNRRFLRTAEPTRVAVDETAIRVDDELCWLYAAIDTESKLLLDVEMFSHHQNRRFWLANESFALVNDAGPIPRRRSWID